MVAGLTAAGRAKREQVRLRAAELRRHEQRTRRAGPHRRTQSGQTHHLIRSCQATRASVPSWRAPSPQETLLLHPDADRPVRWTFVDGRL